MRKTLSIILSVVMILAACSFAIPVSAAEPEGTAISTADEFMAMVSTPADSTEITAKYYLAADITLAGTYFEPFWGILDGNGHTVTVTSPMFTDFSGEVKNLTINGDIYYVDANAAAFAVVSATGFTATNCVNNANVTVTGNGKLAAGFVTDCEKNKNPVVFTDCVNNGNIYIDSTADEKQRAGGFGAIIDYAVLYNCVNNGDIYAKGNIAVTGGLIARVALNASIYRGEFYNCVNNGDVTTVDTYTTTAKAYAGGICGYIGVKNNMGWYKIWGCVNNGKVDGPYEVGGMVGYVYASDGKQAYVDVEFCINTGDIVYGRTQGVAADMDFGSPFVGYTNAIATSIKYNIDIGTISFHDGVVSSRDGHSFFGCSSADALAYDVHDNYILNLDSFKYYSYADPASNPAQIHEMSEVDYLSTTTLEDIKSGKVCYEINQAAAEDILVADYSFYQTLGSDDLPTVDATHGWVVLENGTYTNGVQEVTTAPEVSEPEVSEPNEATQAPDNGDQTTAGQSGGDATQAPNNGDSTTEAPQSTGGCGGFVAGGVAIVAILGTALIIKKRD